MFKNLKIISTFLVILCFASMALAQERTGTMEIVITDSTEAVVPGVPVTITSTGGTVGYKKTLTTDSSGFVRVLQLAPGTYTVTTGAVSGFGSQTLKNIKVVLGEVTPVNVSLKVGSENIVVDVLTSDSTTIDTSSTKIQTNISAEVAELLPKGTNFASLLKVSPATRPEAKSGGYQIDGASGSENTFIIDGNEVTNAISGTLDANNNLPFSIIQEVQIKSSGFEAEYGGATGGVINLVTKGGNNELRGELGISFAPSALQSDRRDILFLEGGAASYLSYAGLDNTNQFFPTATISGPIVKDRLWFLGNYSPQITDVDRTIPYRTLAPLTYRATQTNEYAFGRVDAQPFSSLRLSSTFVWNPIAVEGSIPALSSQFDTLYPSGVGLEGVAFQDQRGGRQNSNITTFQGVWTPTGNIVVSGRYGRNFLNNKLGTYGLSAPFPYTLSNSRLACSTASAPMPSAGCQPGTSNGIPWADATVFDATVRETIDFDGTYIANFGGRHEFKGGYQYNKIFNEVLAPRNAYLLLYYGSPINARSGRNVTPTPGNIGTGRWIRFGAQGKASSTNDGIYIQDKFQPTNRLTLNLGIRFEKEEVPSFNEFSAIKFDWTDKIAPRIGAAYDLTGDGKTKVSGFFGWFYDRFKYELPRGSFGGNVFVSDYFELFDPNKQFNTYNPSTAYGGSNPPITVGGNCPTTGTVFGQIRCQVDHRVPSNDPNLDIAEQGGIDPNIKAYRQTEITFTFERELNNNYLLAARYTRKKLDRAVEDAGFITPSGSEAYIIGNPGLGLVKQFYEDNGWIPTTAKRTYDAVEIRLNRRFANDFYFNANYTWSRLYGNYSGLASSDEEGRTDPNVSRAFDAPFTEATVAGGETVGLLATDRPHVFKFSGAYSLDWSKRFGMGSGNTTEFQTFFSAASGTPLTTFVNVAGYDNIILNQRGDMGRTPFFTETDFAVRHRYKFGRDNRFTMVGELDILNLFNQDTVTDRFNLLDNNVYDLTDPAFGLISVAEANDPTINQTQLAERRFQANGAPGIAAAVAASTNHDVRYDFAENFQGPRSVRFGFRFIF